MDYCFDSEIEAKGGCSVKLLMPAVSQRTDLVLRKKLFPLLSARAASAGWHKNAFEIALNPLSCIDFSEVAHRDSWNCSIFFRQHGAPGRRGANQYEQ